MLEEAGAEVVHVPLIRVIDPLDGGAALRAELHRLDRYRWLVVTSAHGAARVGEAASRHPAVRLAAVGTTTAERLARLAGRPVDVVPTIQQARGLSEGLGRHAHPGDPILVAQADRADGSFVADLERRGFAVTACTAYRTEPLPPDPDAVAGADVLVLASGSAATAWAATSLEHTPPVVVAIGPSTAAVARDAGIEVTDVAADHSVGGLVVATIDAVTSRRRRA